MFDHCSINLQVQYKFRVQQFGWRQVWTMSSRNRHVDLYPPVIVFWPFAMYRWPIYMIYPLKMTNHSNFPWQMFKTTMYELSLAILQDVWPVWLSCTGEDQQFQAMQRLLQLGLVKKVCHGLPEATLLDHDEEFGTESHDGPFRERWSTHGQTT